MFDISFSSLSHHPKSHRAVTYEFRYIYMAYFEISKFYISKLFSLGFPWLVLPWFSLAYSASFWLNVFIASSNSWMASIAVAHDSSVK